MSDFQAPQEKGTTPNTGKPFISSENVDSYLNNQGKVFAHNAAENVVANATGNPLFVVQTVEQAYNQLSNDTYFKYGPLQYAKALGLDAGSIINKFINFKPNQDIIERQIQLNELSANIGSYGENHTGPLGYTVVDRWVELTSLTDPTNFIVLDIVFLNISNKNEWVITPLLGFNGGACHEMTTTNDYNVSIQGAFFTNNPYTRPYDQIIQLLSIIDNPDAPGVFKIRSPYFTAICNENNGNAYDTLILLEKNFDEPQDFKNSLTFNFTCLTDLDLPIVATPNDKTGYQNVSYDGTINSTVA